MAAKHFESNLIVLGQPVVLDDDPRLSAGTAHSVEALVDFGHATGGAETMATVTVLADWVTAEHSILCAPAARTSADHDPYDATIEGLSAHVTSIVPGVSFDILVYAPYGTWGRYYINAISIVRG